MKTLHRPPVLRTRPRASRCSSTTILAVCSTVLLASACSDVVPAASKFAPGFGGPDAGTAADAGDDAGSVDAKTADGGSSKECQTATDCEKFKGSPGPCREHTCSAAGTCGVADIKDNTPCNDNDKCTKDEKCLGGQCKGTAGSTCDDGNDCTKDACDPKTGKCKDPEKLSGIDHKCDDGSACTETDTCKNGKCVGGTDTCVCKADADCASKQPGTKCLGTMYCDKTVKNHACKVNPATVPFCSTIDDTVCMKNTCAKATGACLSVPWYQAKKQCQANWPSDLKCHGKLEGSSCCYLGNDKTKNAPSKKPACDDGDECTVSICGANGGCAADVNICPCTSAADCAKKEDGNPCNGTLYCDVTLAKPTCVVNPASVVKCADVDNTACKQNVCDTKTGACAWVITKTKFLACTDGNPCTVGDTCNNKTGACDPGTDTCTCKSDSDCASFEDGDPCNGTFFCDKTGKQPGCKLNPKTVVVCSQADDDACKANRCDKKTGKCAFEHSDKFTTCNADGNPCTHGDYCDGKGGCVVGTHICTCEKNADCASKDDGNVCNGTLFCDTAVVPPRCKVNAKTIVTCNTDKDTTCAKNLCDKKSGKCGVVNVSSNVLCDDGDKCTVGDSCKSGKCEPGTDVCTCKEDADCKDDGNPCNGVDFCDKQDGKCKANPSTVVKCDSTKDTGCAKSLCDIKTGKCALVGDGKCAEKSLCTFDACDIATGKCKQTGAVVDGTACGKGGTCIAGACKAAVTGMVIVPGGQAQLGCNKTLDTKCAAAADEGPQVKITLTPFYIDAYEVTVDAYGACIKAGKCKAPAATGAKCNHGKANRGNHPLNCVTYKEARGYCASLGKDLPTEAQWEAAARGVCLAWTGSCTKKMPTWPWGETAANCAMSIIKDGGKEGCDADSTHPVGARPKDESIHGVHDLGGSVSEWVLDWYDKSAYAAFAGKTNPEHTTKSNARVIRGGNLKEGADWARAGNREAQDPTTADYSIGFRCVQAVK